VKHLVHKGDGNRAFTDSRRHALDAASSHVANREHSRQTGFEKMGSPGERPFRLRQIFWRKIRSRLDETIGVEGNAAVQPARGEIPPQVYVGLRGRTGASRDGERRGCKRLIRWDLSLEPTIGFEPMTC